MKKNLFMFVVVLLLAGSVNAGWLGDYFDDFFSVMFATPKASAVEKGGFIDVVVGVESHKLNEPLEDVGNVRGWAIWPYDKGVPSFVEEIDAVDDNPSLLGKISMFSLFDTSEARIPVNSLNAGSTVYWCDGCTIGGGVNKNSEASYTLKVETENLPLTNGLGHYYVAGYVCYGERKLIPRIICDAAVKEVWVYSCGECGATDDICLVNQLNDASDAVELFEEIASYGGGVCRSRQTVCRESRDCRFLATQSRQLDGEGFSRFGGAAHCEKSSPRDAVVAKVNQLNTQGTLGVCERGAVLSSDCEAVYSSASNYGYVDKFGLFHVPASWGVDDDGNCVLGECGSAGDCASIYDDSSSSWACVMQPRNNFGVSSVGVCRRTLLPGGECGGDSDCDDAGCPSGTVNHCYMHAGSAGDVGLCQCTEAAPPPEHCSDGVMNFDEEGVDCGGSCKPCYESVVPAHCVDGVQSGNEEGIDCGGDCPVACTLLSGGEARSDSFIFIVGILGGIMLLILLFVIMALYWGWI